MHVGHDVVPVDLEPHTGRHAEGDVKDRPVLGDVDVLAGEHGVAAPGDAGPLGEAEKEAERLVGDSVLGVVEDEVAGLHHIALCATGVVSEELAQVEPAH